MSAKNRQELLDEIAAYHPFNEQEERDKNLIFQWIEQHEDAFSRENTVAHVTASAWMVNKDRSKVDGYVKKGKYISSHLHLNITYLLEADSEEDVRIKADENSGVAWFTSEEALQKSTEPWFVERVYGKLIEKVKRI